MNIGLFHIEKWEIKIEFEFGHYIVIITFQVTLQQRNGTGHNDVTGKWWDTFGFDNYNIYASMVKIIALSVYTKVNNGFVEVEFYGTKPGEFDFFVIAVFSYNMANGLYHLVLY